MDAINPTLLAGAVALFGFCLWAIFHQNGRLKAMESKLANGILAPVERDISGLRTSLKDDLTKQAEEIKSLRTSRHDFANNIMGLLHDVDHLKEDVRILKDQQVGVISGLADVTKGLTQVLQELNRRH